MKLNKLILIGVFVPAVACGEVVGRGTSLEGHQINITNEPCTVVSGRSSQPSWGRVYSYLPNGVTVTGCGRLENDTVLVEWYIPPATLDSRRYSVDKFQWQPGYGNQ